MMEKTRRRIIPNSGKGEDARVFYAEALQVRCMSEHVFGDQF